jgi:hypothetical protein
MGNRNQKLSTVKLKNVEVRSGSRTCLPASDDTLYQVTKPGGQPLPRGVLAVSEKDRVVLRYPDGTEIIIPKDQ